jgi:hypothetical protein
VGRMRRNLKIALVWSVIAVVVIVGLIIGSFVIFQKMVGTSEVPIYPEAKFLEEESEKAKSSLEQQYQIKDCQVKLYTTSDEPTKVLDFYRNEMKKLGWELRDEKGTGNTLVSLYKKSDQGVAIAIGYVLGQTQIGIISGPWENIIHLWALG